MEIKIHTSMAQQVRRMAAGMTLRLERSQMARWVQTQGSLAGPKELSGQSNACEALVGSNVYAGLHIIGILAILLKFIGKINIFVYRISLAE